MVLIKSKVIRSFESRSADHKTIIASISNISPDITIELIDGLDIKEMSALCKFSIKKTKSILTDLRMAIENNIITKKKIFVPEYSMMEFDQLFERFCNRSKKHRTIAETIRFDPDVSTKDREVINKTRLSESTGFSVREVEDIMEEMRGAFSEFG
jgi:hypothetical protein